MSTLLFRDFFKHSDLIISSYASSVQEIPDNKINKASKNK
ncbi:hypothetical protein [Klebsiella pneumoniae IS39]|nr:hypothetical protein P244_2739 [Klebsiella pneumoniae HK787]CDK74995.1 hypothetical protein [Klebsiella pneumoniae IS22]CDL60058.1 hypothetical protein [Klebsiella pneumoniae IS39]